MVTVILCVFLLSYMYGEGKVSRETRFPQPNTHPSSGTLLTTPRKPTEQLLQRQHPPAHLPRRHRRLLPRRLFVRHGCPGYRPLRHPGRRARDLQDDR